MSIVLPALAVAFAAFCVWLGVRIVNRRERWAKWTAVVVVALLVGYPLSFGPAFGLVENNALPRRGLDCVYLPFVALIANPQTAESRLALMIHNYARICDGGHELDDATDRYDLRRNTVK
jgi:hypothetical protein